jgi:hypothetical protein
MEITKQDEKIPEMQSQATCSRQRANDRCHGHLVGFSLYLNNKGLQACSQQYAPNAWRNESVL